MVDYLEQHQLTDEEIYQKALCEEAELARQSRAYTLLDRDREQVIRCGGAGGAKLARYRKVFDIFLQEQNNIQTDLTVATRKEKIVEDDKKQKRLSQLLKIYDDHMKATKLDTEEVQEIEYQIEVLKKKIVELSAQQISDQKILDRQLKAEKTLEKLENKLEVQVRKCCQIGAENRKLRDELTQLLNERSNFNRTWNDLIRKLIVGKKIMMDLIEQASIAYNQREECCIKLNLLRVKAHNDFKVHLQNMQSYQRVAQHKDKVMEYFSVKNQNRIMVGLQDKILEKLEEQRKNKKEMLDYYQKTMMDVKEAINKESVQKIAESFLREEEENFSRLKLVNELNRQSEDISEHLFALHKEIEQQQKQNEKWGENQSGTLKKLKEQTEDSKKKLDSKEAELNKADRNMKFVFDNVKNLFKLFNCAVDPIVQILGNHGEEINYYNAILYLQIIETNVQEALVTTYAREKLIRQKKGPGQTYLIRNEKSQVELAMLENFGVKNPCPLCIEHEMVLDIVDELQTAYTKEEVLERLEQRLKLKKSSEIVHNVSACKLPKSRQIMQQRYQ